MKFTQNNSYTFVFIKFHLQGVLFVYANVPNNRQTIGENSNASGFEDFTNTKTQQSQDSDIEEIKSSVFQTQLVPPRSCHW